MLNGALVVLDGLCHPSTFNLLSLSLRLLVFVRSCGGTVVEVVTGNSGSSLCWHFVSFCANFKVAGDGVE